MSSNPPHPRVVDNDRDEITATLDGKEIRGWSYSDEAERRVKMLAAREFCEGWFQASDRIEPALKAAHKALLIAGDHGNLSGGAMARKYSMSPFEGYAFVLRHIKPALAKLAAIESRQPNKEGAA